VEIFETVVDVGNKYVWSTPGVFPWLVALLLGAGLFITLRLAFIQLRHVGHALMVVMGRYDDPNDPGDVTHFQALSTALSATVGIGNIAGVATAIHYGGPGAVFWMWVTAFFGMALKFGECTLSMHYRSFDDRGDAAGGPMYYIEKGLGKHWKPMAMFFAFCAIISSFGGGNMNQANTVAVSATSDFGVSKYIVAVILAVAVGAVILGGIRSIAKVASTLAPSMALLYVAGALTILMLNAGDVPGAFGTIISDAFNPKASLGGSVAGIWSVTLLWGVKRGLFSNEAGQGSAPIAHAAAKTKEPVREGAVAMLGPLIDTLIICTMTALVIVITGVWDDKKADAVGLGSASVIAVTNGAKVVPKGDKVVVTAELVDGKPTGLGFMAKDGAVSEPWIATAADGKPFKGKLVYTIKKILLDSGMAKAKEMHTAGDAAKSPLFDSVRHEKNGVIAVGTQLNGTITAFDSAGKEVGPAKLLLKGGMLQNSSALTGWAFKRGLSPIGDFGNYLVTICVFLFALSTMISWSYYGDRCVTYLFGSKYVIPYRLVFIGFVALGAILSLEVVWAYGDLALGLMTVPNLIAVVLLSPKIVELSRDYFKRMKEQKKGELPKATAKDGEA